MISNKKSPIEGTISPSKLAVLNDSSLQSMVGNEYGYYLNVSRINTDGTPGATIKQVGSYRTTQKILLK